MSDVSVDSDVIIIGGGPAGLSAALWCADLGLAAILIEREPEFGGQLLWTYNAIRNYLGIEAAGGRELRDRFLIQVENTNVRRLSLSTVVKANLERKTVMLDSGQQLRSKAIVIATGVRRRTLGIPGEMKFRSHGILESGAKCKDQVHGKTVVIVGGGDAAIENALILSSTARSVTVIHRRGQSSARPAFVEAAQYRENIEFRFNSRAIAILGHDSVESVEVEDVNSGVQSLIPTENVLIRIGVIPNTDLFHGQIEMDASGFLKTNSDCSTNVDRIFAAGDVANRVSPTVSSSSGTGATAANSVHWTLSN